MGDVWVWRSLWLAASVLVFPAASAPFRAHEWTSVKILRGEVTDQSIAEASAPFRAHEGTSAKILRGEATDQSIAEVGWRGDFAIPHRAPATSLSHDGGWGSHKGLVQPGREASSAGPWTPRFAAPRAQEQEEEEEDEERLRREHRTDLPQVLSPAASLSHAGVRASHETQEKHLAERALGHRLGSLVSLTANSFRANLAAFLSGLRDGQIHSATLVREAPVVHAPCQYPSSSNASSLADYDEAPPAAWSALQNATEFFCKAGGALRGLLEAQVDHAFRGNYRKFYSERGWAEEGFVNYVSLGKQEFLDETELLIDSVHDFAENQTAIVVFVFHDNLDAPLPGRWTPENYPRLVVMRAKSMPQGLMRESFNFNKLRAMILSQVLTGVQLDSDQIVFLGTERLFRRTREEVTPEYPYPIMPVHWMSRDPDASFPDHPYSAYDFICPGCPPRSARWAQAHPTWTFYALPFLGRWLHKALTSSMEQYQDPVAEDEDILNVALWEAGVKKQWCKFDGAIGTLVEQAEHAALLAKPTADGRLQLSTAARMYDMTSMASFQDPKWYPRGIPQAFTTAHMAKNSTETRQVLVVLRAVRKQATEQLPLLSYDGRGFDSFEALKTVYPDCPCIF